MLVHRRDTKGILEEVFKKVIEKEFSQLSEMKINYTFRSTPDTDEEGRPAAATAKKLSNRERDLYGFDFEICVHEDTWKEFSKSQREEVAFHELCHCIVFFEKDDEGEDTEEYLVDGAGRIMIGIEPHDLMIKSFKREVEKYGIAMSGASTALWIYRYVKKHKSLVKKLKVKWEKILEEEQSQIEGEEEEE